MPSEPAILTTTVGSYPIPDWLAALPSEQARVDAIERLEHHQLGAQEADPLDLECCGALDLRGLGQVDEELRGGDGGGADGEGRRAGGSWCR